MVHLIVSPVYLLPSWNLSSVGVFSMLGAVIFVSDLTEPVMRITTNIAVIVALVDSRRGFITTSELIFGLKIVVACQIQHY